MTPPQRGVRELFPFAWRQAAMGAYPLAATAARIAQSNAFGAQ